MAIRQERSSADPRYRTALWHQVCPGIRQNFEVAVMFRAPTVNSTVSAAECAYRARINSGGSVECPKKCDDSQSGPTGLSKWELQIERI